MTDLLLQDNLRGTLSELFQDQNEGGNSVVRHRYLFLTGTSALDQAPEALELVRHLFDTSQGIGSGQYNTLRQYLVDGTNHTNKKAYSRAYQLEPVLAMGGARSGIPFHRHNEAWLYALQGRKKWSIYPPAVGEVVERYFDRSISHAEWLGSNRPLPSVLAQLRAGDAHCRRSKGSSQGLYGHSDARGSCRNGTTSLEHDGICADPPPPPSSAPSFGNPLVPLECVQHPGEILYVPEGWWHAVSNIDHFTAAVGAQVCVLLCVRRCMCAYVCGFKLVICALCFVLCALCFVLCALCTLYFMLCD